MSNFKSDNDILNKKLKLGHVTGSQDIMTYDKKILELGLDELLNVNLCAIEKSLLMQNSMNLMIAPTGSGKTYAIVKVFKTKFINKKSKHVKYINILVIPTVAQLEQIEKEYKLPVLTGGTAIDIVDDLIIANTICIILELNWRFSSGSSANASEWW